MGLSFERVRSTLQELKVVSVVESVSVALEGDGSLYFPPTAVCSQSQRSHRIQNQSHLPLRLVGRVVLLQHKNLYSFIHITVIDCAARQIPVEHSGG